MSNSEEIISNKNHKHEGKSECCGNHSHESGDGCCKNNKHSDEHSCGHKHSKSESSLHQDLEHGAEKTATNNEWTSTNMK